MNICCCSVAKRPRPKGSYIQIVKVNTNLEIISENLPIKSRNNSYMTRKLSLNFDDIGM